MTDTKKTPTHFDIKITTWERITLPEDCDEITDFINSTESADAVDIIEFCDERGIDVEYSRIDDSDAYIYPDENDGNATIELFSNESKLWDNEDSTPFKISYTI